jgi:propanediol dehydratase small subunit
VVNKNLVPEQHLENIKGDLKDYREKWNELLKKAEHVEDRYLSHFMFTGMHLNL